MRTLSDPFQTVFPVEKNSFSDSHGRGDRWQLHVGAVQTPVAKTALLSPVDAALCWRWVTHSNYRSLETVQRIVFPDSLGRGVSGSPCKRPTPSTWVYHLPRLPGELEIIFRRCRRRRVSALVYCKSILLRTCRRKMFPDATVRGSSISGVVVTTYSGQIFSSASGCWHGLPPTTPSNRGWVAFFGSVSGIGVSMGMPPTAPSCESEERF